MIINVKSKFKNYDIIIEQGSLSKINEYFDIDKKTLIITDDNVSKLYLDKLKEKLKNCFIFEVNEGELSKSLNTYVKIINYLQSNKFSRKDRIIALGGGVIGDLSGFVAATYKRGIEFINIPTTTLSMIDSSIGGKTSLNFNGIKNIIGSFYAPSLVLIDVDTLKTLDDRNYNSGLVEAIKMSMTHDNELFQMFLDENYQSNIEKIIIKSLNIKKSVVEEDEFENGNRKSLNFGHTLGHAIESLSQFELLHGEAVALGIFLICKNKYYLEDLKNIFVKLNMPLELIKNIDYNVLVEYIMNDKKITANDNIEFIEVNNIGEFNIVLKNIKDLTQYFGG